jgi:exodeoxyribonuclease-5
MTYTASQARVLGEAAAWLEDPNGDQVKYLAGYAGSGKTTMARDLGIEAGALFAAYTGKAALVMQTKGCPSPTTLHSLVFRAEEGRDPETGKPRIDFIRRDDSPLAGASLLVIDECSMVDAELAAIVLSFGTRVLVIGDPAQLPPVGGGGYFTERTPDWMLTEVHRQARESGILRLATDIREGRGYDRSPGAYGPDVEVMAFASLDAESFTCIDNDADQIIVGTNVRRHAMNDFCRGVRGFTAPLPARLDKLVCLRNDHQKGLQNGNLYRVQAAPRVGGDWCELEIKPDDGGLVQSVVAHTHHFLGNESALEAMPWREQKRRQSFDYGYAITCHKSQGSQWNNVVVVDDSRVFREDAKRWLYTAVTRAAQHLVMVTT